MKDLMFSEWRRFSRLTLVVAVCHALALLFLSRITNLLQLRYDDHAALLFVYMLLGITLALLQVGSYRKPSQWLWLIHRPLPLTRIFQALATSALAMLSLAVLAPLLVFVLATDLFTTQVVDSRHYAVLLHVLAFTMMGWFAGAHAVLSRHKAAIAVLLVPLLLALHMASVWWLMLPVLASLAWLATITLHGFRADRDAPIARTSVLLLTALPLQLGFFLLIFHLSKASVELVELMRDSRQHAKLVLATDAESSSFALAFGQEFLIKGLAQSTDPRAPSWREQLPLLEVAEVVPGIDRYPIRNQIGNLGGPRWDEKRKIEWTFSHDQMKFHGRDGDTGAERGWWGRTGAGSTQPFTQPPMLDLSRDTLYAIDEETQRQHELIRLPPGEVFLSRPTRALDHLLLVTDKRVLAYRPDRKGNSLFAPPLLQWAVPLPKSDTPVMQIHLASLMDGWLVSFFHDPSREFDGFQGLVEPWQQVVFVDEAGNASVVGERRGIHDHHVSWGWPSLAPTASWWLSPGLYSLARWSDAALDKGLTRPQSPIRLPAVPLFYPLAAGLMLLSLALGYWWLRGTQAGPARRRVWLATCAALGLPAFLSLLCLEPRAPRR